MNTQREVCLQIWITLTVSSIQNSGSLKEVVILYNLSVSKFGSCANIGITENKYLVYIRQLSDFESKCWELPS